MNNVNEVCRYWTSHNEYVIVLFDNETEEIYIINDSQKSIEIISELKDMNIDMLERISDDFESFVNVDKELFYYSIYDIDWIETQNCGLELLQALKEYGIEPRKE